MSQPALRTPLVSNSLPSIVGELRVLVVPVGTDSFRQLELRLRRAVIVHEQLEARVGDQLVLREWDPHRRQGATLGDWTDRWIARQVTDVFASIDHMGLTPGYCLVSLNDVSENDDAIRQIRIALGRHISSCRTPNDFWERVRKEHRL